MKKRNFIYLLILFFLIISTFFFFMKRDDLKQENTVVFWTLQLGTFDKYINNIIAEFEKENENIRIKWIDVPYSEGEKRTLASILTDNPPDLVNLTPDFSLLLAQKNALEMFEEQDLEQFLPELNQMLKYNDKYFGIPFYATSAVTLYNSNLYSGKAISTYDELFSLTPKNNFYLTMISLAENDTLLKLLNKYDVNTPDKITSEKSIKIFEKLKYIYQKGYIPKESITQSHRDALEKYMSSQLAFLVTGANFLNMIKENAPSVYKVTKVSNQLVGDTNKYDYSLMNFVIPKKAHNKQAALKFALFLTNKDNQLEFAKLTTILPVNAAALNDDYFKNSDDDIQVQARKISAEQLLNLQPPIQNIKNKKELNTLSSNYLQEILINNAQINETLIKFQKDWKKL